MDFDDDLDLLDDDGDGVIEVCILEEEENGNTSNSKSGCCVVLFVLGSSTLLSIWGMMEIFT